MNTPRETAPSWWLGFVPGSAFHDWISEQNGAGNGLIERRTSGQPFVGIDWHYQIGVDMLGGRVRRATALFICGFAIAVLAIVLVMWWATAGTNVGTS